MNFGQIFSSWLTFMLLFGILVALIVLIDRQNRKKSK